MYWHGDCAAVKHYREADRLRRERKNYELWLQGMYIYEAIGDMAPVLRAFAKPNTHPIPYTSEPYSTTEEEKKRSEEKRAKEEAENLKSFLKGWADTFNTKFNQKSEVRENGAGTDGQN